MIAEPYICIKGPRAGEIYSITAIGDALSPESWQRYADFEQEKLASLEAKRCEAFSFPTISSDGYFINWSGRILGGHYSSANLIGYGWHDHRNDSESGRLLKRAEFLKAVCEKEGVEWIASPLNYENARRIADSEIERASCNVCHGEKVWQNSGEIVWCGQCLGQCGMARLRKTLFPEREYYTKAEMDEKFRNILKVTIVQNNVETKPTKIKPKRSRKR